MFKRIKTIRSHAGLAQLIAEMDDDDDVGYLAVCQIEPIRRPYHSGPTVALFRWKGRTVFWAETSHRRYEVFEVPAEMLRFKTEEEARDWHVRYRKKSA